MRYIMNTYTTLTNKVLAILKEANETNYLDRDEREAYYKRNTPIEILPEEKERVKLLEELFVEVEKLKAIKRTVACKNRETIEPLEVYYGQGLLEWLEESNDNDIEKEVLEDNKNGIVRAQMIPSLH